MIDTPGTHHPPELVGFCLLIRRFFPMSDNRITVTGRVSWLKKETALGFCLLYFSLTPEPKSHHAEVLRVCGEIWGPQLAMAEQVEEGSLVTLIGCLKGPDPSATVQLPRLDLEQVLEVA